MGSDVDSVIVRLTTFVIMAHNVNFYYDPARQGYDTTIWKTVTGTPVAEAFDIFPTRTDALSVADVITGIISIPDVSVVDTGSLTESVTASVGFPGLSVADTGSVAEVVTVSVI